MLNLCIVYMYDDAGLDGSEDEDSMEREGHYHVTDNTVVPTTPPSAIGKTFYMHVYTCTLHVYTCTFV